MQDAKQQDDNRVIFLRRRDAVSELTERAVRCLIYGERRMCNPARVQYLDLAFEEAVFDEYSRGAGIHRGEVPLTPLKEHHA